MATYGSSGATHLLYISQVSGFTVGDCGQRRVKLNVSFFCFTQKRFVSISTEVNEIFVAIRCLSHRAPCPPSRPPPTSACTHSEQKRSSPSLATGTDRPELPLGRGPAIRSGPGAEPCSSRVVGGAVLVSLPSLSGPKRGCIWVSLGGAGPARDRRGERGWR